MIAVCSENLPDVVFRKISGLKKSTLELISCNKNVRKVIRTKNYVRHSAATLSLKVFIPKLEQVEVGYLPFGNMFACMHPFR